MTYRVIIRNGQKRTLVASGMEDWEAEDLAEYLEWFSLTGNQHAEVWED